MGVGACLYMYDVVVKKFTFPILSPDEFLVYKYAIELVRKILLLGHERDDCFREH